MNSKPRTVEVRNGKEDGEIGKELSHLSKFVCHLRHAGATYRDFLKMRDIGPVIAGELIAKIRGVRLSPNQAHLPLDAQMVNLDFELGYPEPLSTFTGPFYAQQIEVIRNERLGIWPLEQAAGIYIFADRKFVVERPTGTCVQGNNFCSGNLVGLSDGHKYVNLAMATWFHRNSWIDVPFDNKVVGGPEGGKSIFFLGTVWWDPTSTKYLAPALVSNAKGDKINLKIKPIPDGDWPENCFVALLVLW